MSSSYREYAPGNALRPWVECLWSKRVDPDTGGDFTRVVPDGSVDILLEASSGGGSLIGTMLRPKLIRHRQPLELVAVRFRPGGARPFLGFAAAEITDARIDLDAAAVPGTGFLGERIAAARSLQRRVQLLRRTLIDRLDAVEPPNPLVAEAARRIAATGGNTTVGALTEGLRVGRRRLGRLFARHVGASPKQLCRIVRLQRVLESLRAHPGDTPGARSSPDWVGIAFDCGYFDQSHLVREFRELTGTTPARWLTHGGASADGRTSAPAPADPYELSHPYNTAAARAATVRSTH